MSSRRRAPLRSRLVLLVGGDSNAGRRCARAVSPLPVVRAKHLDIAKERVRDMRPIVVVVADDIAPEETNELRRVALEQAAVLVRLPEDDDPVALRDALLRRPA